MPSLAIFNMAVGFIIIFLAASAGAFLSLDVTDAYLYDRDTMFTWQAVVQRSAHGHSNLFGMLHILFALTMPYSPWNLRIKFWQTTGFLAGSIAMGPVMLWRAAVGPTEGLDLVGIILGVLLSLTLLAIASHIAGLMKKLSVREG